MYFYEDERENRIPFIWKKALCKQNETFFYKGLLEIKQIVFNVHIYMEE